MGKGNARARTNGRKAGQVSSDENARPAVDDGEPAPTHPPLPATYNPPTFDISNRLLFRVFQTSNLMQTRATRFVLAHGVTMQQVIVMGALARPHAAEGMTVRDLCDYLLVSRQNLGDVLARLEALGYTSRITDERDRRARRVILSESGKALWPKLSRTMGDFYRVALHNFTYDDCLAFLFHTDKLKQNLLRT